MVCSGGMSTILYTRSVFSRPFRANFSLSFPRKKIVMGKKIVVPCLDAILIAFLPRNIQKSSLSFARKASVNTEGVPPGYPIILLKSDKFNMAAPSPTVSFALISNYISSKTFLYFKLTLHLR